jgi:hypothetical protein
MNDLSRLIIIGLLLICSGLFAQNLGDIIINEVVTDPQQDWSTTNFEVGSSPAWGAGSNDEAVEILILANGLDLTNWTIELNDGTDVFGDLSEDGAFAVSNYISSNGGTFTSTKTGDYLVLGNVVGAGNINNTSLRIVLKASNGDIIDEVSFGGGSGEAPSGNATSVANQSVSRISNGNNSGDNSEDFIKTITTLGEVNRYSETSDFAGNTLLFDGESAFVKTGYRGRLNAHQRTLECWVKTETDGTIFSYGTNLPLQGSVFGISGGKLMFDINGVKVIGTTEIVDNEWHHLAFVYEGGNITTSSFYIDGELDAFSSSSTGFLNTVASQNLVIGRDFTSNYFKGMLDEVRLWSVARTPTEIRLSMHLTLSGNEAGLEVYYQFNQESGDANEIMTNCVGELYGEVSFVESGVHVGKGRSTIHSIDEVGVFSSKSTATGYSLDVEFSSVHPNGDLLVTYLDMWPQGIILNDENHSTGTWVIHNYGTITSGLDYSMKYSYADGGVISKDISLHHLFKRGSNETGEWISLGSACSVGDESGNNYTKFCNLDGFSQFVVSSSVSPLPVTFLNVEAIVESRRSVVLYWGTVTEKGNNYFTIEKSLDADVFYTVGEIEGVGDSYTQIFYSFEDIYPNKGTSYYRIKQTDFNGDTSYSEMVSVNVNKEFEFLIYPNPAKESVFISTSEPIELTLLTSDFTEQEVLFMTLENGVVVDLSNLSQGLYFMKILFDGKQETRRLIICD